MNKNDASKYLGIGLRTLERHTSAGHIKAQKIKTPNGPALDYAEAELERYKAVLEAPEVAETAPPPPSPEDIEIVAEVTSPTALARIEPQVLAHSGAVGIDVVTVPIEVLAKLADVAASVAEQGTKPRALLGEKLTLSLDEAAELSGLSRGHLRAAIGDGSLTAKKLGRGWRVRRSELERWIEATC